MKVKSESEFAQLCPTLSDPMDCSPSGSSVLKQGLCIHLEGWDGEGDGREIQKGGDICICLWLIHVEV